MSLTVGVHTLVRGGVQIECEKGSKLKLGGWKNNSVVLNGKVHRSREYEASELDITTVLKRGQRITDIFDDGEKETQVLCDSGQSYTFADMFITNRPEITGNGDGGKINVKLAAGDYEELLDA